MNRLKVSKDETAEENRLPDEKALITELSKIWLPHRRKDLEVRFLLGLKLNERLGPPTRRQVHGMGTVRRICNQLKIDAGDISRLRRFAALADTYRKFEAKHKDLKSWTDVRKFLAARESKPKSPNDHRRSTGVLRTLQSVLEKFNDDSGYQFKGSGSDEEIRRVLSEIFAYAKKNLGVKIR